EGGEAWPTLPVERARFRAAAARLRAWARPGSETSVCYAMRIHGDRRAYRFPVHHDAERLLPAAGHRIHYGLIRSRRGHVIRCDAQTPGEAGRNHRRRSGGGHLCDGGRRQRLELGDEHWPIFYYPEAQERT